MVKSVAVPSRPRRDPRRYLAGVLLVAVVGLVLYRYVWVSEEERVRRMVGKGAKAVEEQSVLRCADLVAPDYSDSTGFDKRTLVDAARRMFERFGKIEAQIEQMSFDQPPAEGPPDQWQARVRLRMSVKLYEDRGVAEIIDEDPRAEEFVVLHLVKRNRRWLLQRMEFENVDILDYSAY